MFDYISFCLRNGSVIAVIDITFSELLVNRLDPLRTAIKAGTVGSLPVDNAYKAIGKLSNQHLIVPGIVSIRFFN